jgi:hypothetical protein
MYLQRPDSSGGFFKPVLLFFPTALCLLFSLITFVLGVGGDLAGLRRMSEFTLRVSGWVFYFFFLPLSEQSGLFKNFQARQGSPVP